MSKRNPNINLKYPNVRIDNDFRKDMKECASVRLGKGFANLKPNEVSVREMTALLRKTNAYPNCLLELKTKPKKRQ
jgi:hypothetical protein